MYIYICIYICTLHVCIFIHIRADTYIYICIYILLSFLRGVQAKPEPYYNAAHGNTLQHAATRYNTLQHNATHSNSFRLWFRWLKHGMACRLNLSHTVLQPSATQCTKLQHTGTPSDANFDRCNVACRLASSNNASFNCASCAWTVPANFMHSIVLSAMMCWNWTSCTYIQHM